MKTNICTISSFFIAPHFYVFVSYLIKTHWINYHFGLPYCKIFSTWLNSEWLCRVFPFPRSIKLAFAVCQCTLSLFVHACISRDSRGLLDVSIVLRNFICAPLVGLDQISRRDVSFYYRHHGRPLPILVAVKAQIFYTLIQIGNPAPQIFFNSVNLLRIVYSRSSSISKVQKILKHVLNFLDRRQVSSPRRTRLDCTYRARKSTIHQIELDFLRFQLAATQAEILCQTSRKMYHQSTNVACKIPVAETHL